MTFFKLTIPFLFCVLPQCCHSVSPAFQGNHPWFTGPLLTTSGRVVQRGHVLLEPYNYLTFITGQYDDFGEIIKVPTVTQVNPLIIVKIGMTEKINFTTVFQGILNTSQNKSSVGFGDLPVGFEFQLYNDGNYAAKFALQEIFPTGKFEKLDVSKFGTEARGQGSFITQPGLTFAKLTHFDGEHYLSIRLNLSVNLPTPLNVKGINVYGGDQTTVGKVFPGVALAVSLGAEYSLTENWALACDIAGLFAGPDRFKGSTVIRTGFNASNNISLAPAIEYNWNEHIGFIAGCWFTMAGRNTNQFTSAVVALNIFY